jgi:hypothetical protein
MPPLPNLDPSERGGVKMRVCDLSIDSLVTFHALWTHVLQAITSSMDPIVHFRFVGACIRRVGETHELGPTVQYSGRQRLKVILPD